MNIKELKRVITNLDIEGEDPFLLVAWKERRQIIAATVRLASDMKAPLRGICKAALESIKDREMRVYSADARLNRVEEGMWVDSSRINEDAVFVGIIDRIPTVDEITATAAASQRLLFHAIGFFEGDDLTLFVRRRFKQLQTGRKEKTLGLASEALRPIEKPVIVFDGVVDFIWRTEGIVAFNEEAFDGLLRDPEDIRQELDDNLEAISDSLMFDEDTFERLHDHALKGTMLRKRIRSLSERSYLKDVAVKDIRSKMKAQGIDPQHYIKNGRLAFDMTRALTLFRFLSEGTWNGIFTGTLYGSDGQSEISSDLK